MITRWKSALRFSLFVSIPMVAALPMRAGSHPECDQLSASADMRRASSGQRSTGTRDRITLHQESGTLRVDVKHVTGIGRTQLHPPPSGWPGRVLVRLLDFPDLESLRVSTADAALICERIRPEGISPRLACHLGEAEIHAIRQQPGYLEIAVPPMLFAGDGPVEIQWVDQWR